ADIFIRRANSVTVIRGSACTKRTKLTLRRSRRSLEIGNRFRPIPFETEEFCDKGLRFIMYPILALSYSFARGHASSSPRLLCDRRALSLPRPGLCGAALLRSRSARRRLAAHSQRRSHLRHLAPALAGPGGPSGR